MNMTEQAKTYIQQAMVENAVDTIRFYSVAGCCGSSLAVALQPAEESDLVEIIDEVKIAIQPEMKEELSNVTIATEEDNGELSLVLEGYNPSTCCEGGISND